MANVHRGEVTLTVPGEGEAPDRAFTLCLGANGVAELEDHLDMRAGAIFEDLEEWDGSPDKVSFRWVIALLWACLRKHHPEVDIRAAGELVDDVGLLEIVPVIFTCVTSSRWGGKLAQERARAQALEQQGEEGKQRPDPPADGTGTSSSGPPPPSASPPPSSGG